jgi:hypothetical protein
MKVFLSHASEDKASAESITFSLRNRGHLVFLDRDDLPAGESYDQRIERAIKDSDLFIFLVSPSSVAQGRYTLTELAFARRKWQHPSGHVLPVMAVKTPFNEIPEYLKAVTILEPLGNITPETSAIVDDLAASADRESVPVPPVSKFVVFCRHLFAVVMIFIMAIVFAMLGGSLVFFGLLPFESSMFIQETARLFMIIGAAIGAVAGILIAIGASSLDATRKSAPPAAPHR